MPLKTTSGNHAKIRWLTRPLKAPSRGVAPWTCATVRFTLLADGAPVRWGWPGVEGGAPFRTRGGLASPGRSLEQELGAGWPRGVSPADLDACLRVYRDAFQARREFEMEYRLRRR